MDLILPVYEEFAKTDLNTLPRCFVHGDILDPNIIKDNKSKLWIIDFSVANYYPRIVDLAIFLCGPCYNPSDEKQFSANYDLVVKEYLRNISLTSEELHKLPFLVKAAHATNMVGAARGIALDGPSKENDYWLDTSRKGLKYLS